MARIGRILGLFTMPSVMSIVLTPMDAVKGAVVFGAGDAVAQRIERRAGSTVVPCIERRDESAYLDADRLAVAVGLGSVHGGLVLPFVYQFAESLAPGVTMRNVLLKVAISCGMLSTAGNYYNLLVRRLMSPSEALSVGEHVRQCVSSVHCDFAEVLRKDLRLWPLYDLACFAVIPPALRPMATSIVSTCWHTYVSFLASNPMPWYAERQKLA